MFKALGNKFRQIYIFTNDMNLDTINDAHNFDDAHVPNILINQLKHEFRKLRKVKA